MLARLVRTAGPRFALMSKTGARGFHGMQADACGYHGEPIAVRTSTYLADATGVYAYKPAQSWLHWAMAAGVVTVVGTVKLSQNSTAEQRKKWGVSKASLMNIHKSTAIVLAALIVPRVALRLVSFAPIPPPGPVLEQAAGIGAHWLLYGFMVALPASGIAMGYYSGPKGLPFFGTYLGSAKRAPDKDKAKAFYGQHKWLGSLFVYLVPLHIFASLLHAFNGVNLFRRFKFN